MEKEKREIEQNKMGMVREKIRKIGNKKKGNGWLEQTKEIIEYYEVIYPKEMKKRNNKQKYQKDNKKEKKGNSEKKEKNKQKKKRKKKKRKKGKK